MSLHPRLLIALDCRDCYLNGAQTTLHFSPSAVASLQPLGDIFSITVFIHASLTVISQPLKRQSRSARPALAVIDSIHTKLIDYNA
jgi:hypothetical protein